MVVMVVVRVVVTMLAMGVLVVKVRGHQAPLTIINGTDVVLTSGQDSFLYCFAGDGSSWGRWWRQRGLAVVWKDPQGRLVPRWRSETGVWTVEEPGAQVPHSYLIVRNFRARQKGRYTCQLRAARRVLATTTTTLWHFMPSYRVLPLPRCLTVKRGATVLLPFPVVGAPPRPPLWRRMDARLDPAAVRHLPGGLLLTHVTGPGMYRVKVPLGAGLSYSQDVMVTPSSTPATTPSSACPTNDVTTANLLIHDIQIHAFRRRLAQLPTREDGGEGVKWHQTRKI